MCKFVNSLMKCRYREGAEDGKVREVTAPPQYDCITTAHFQTPVFNWLIS